MKISEKHYLGPLCKRNHDYNNSGKSLRHKKYRYCLKCSKNWKKDIDLVAIAKFLIDTNDLFSIKPSEIEVFP